MLELYQAEWCPYSHRVRERLTELGLSYVVHQVPPEASDRDELRRRTSSEEIPALIVDGLPIHGDADELIAYLDREFPESGDAAEHRRQAEEHAAAR